MVGRVPSIIDRRGGQVTDPVVLADIESGYAAAPAELIARCEEVSPTQLYAPIADLCPRGLRASAGHGSCLVFGDSRYFTVFNLRLLFCQRRLGIRHR